MISINSMLSAKRLDKKDKNKRHQLNVRLTTEDRDNLQKIAKEKNCSVTKLIRKWITGKGFEHPFVNILQDNANSINESKLMTYEDVAEYCNVSVASVRKWCHQGKLKSINLGHKIKRIDPKDFKMFIYNSELR
jgi:excisionase family DNA binding protein